MMATALFVLDIHCVLTVLREPLCWLVSSLQLSGNSIVDLMRKHKKTIRQIAERNSITMKRVREVREKGVEVFIAENWLFIITGMWPDSVMTSI
jgi:hypothetical protein